METHTLSPQSTIYLNPTARTWQAPYTVPPSVLPFHRTLPHYSQTPLLRLPPHPNLNLNLHHIFLKDESNRFGLPAFKILGASYASYRALTQKLGLPSTSSLEGVKEAAAGHELTLCAATDGNFGRAVARMARLMGVRAGIFVPEIMAEETQRLIAGEGAGVTVVKGDYNHAVREAEMGSRAESGGLLVQDDAWEGYEEIPQGGRGGWSQWVVDGYSTMMVEIDEQVLAAAGRHPDFVVVPVGVGSLAHAVVAYYKHRRPLPVIVTVEPDTAAGLKTSLEYGERTSVATGDTAMCGMNCGSVSFLAWPYLQNGVDASVTVTEEQAKAALDMLTEMQVFTGPCSAGTLAALIKTCEEGRKELGLHQESLFVLLGTEGPR